MSFVINTNPSASVASVNLRNSNVQLQKSLNRLSSGKKIVNPADDAGGLAVSMKLMAAQKRTDAVNNNIANAISFLQSQDGALQLAADVLTRISELKMLASDVTKNAEDIANYEKEYTELQKQLDNITNERFNNVTMFVPAGDPNATISVLSTEDGASAEAIDLTKPDLAALLNTVTTTDLATISVSDVVSALQSVATQRASKGAETSRLQFASQMLVINRTNLEAANSRIIDTDLAEESTRLAKYNILTQSGAAMLAQANQIQSVALQLLQ
ncbi:MAG: flagellin [Opitutales bacterium]